MDKFKVGDKVRCVEGQEVHEEKFPGGAGWLPGMEFTVIEVTPRGSDASVYWGGNNGGSGVYEDWLELVPEPKIEEWKPVSIPDKWKVNL